MVGDNISEEQLNSIAHRAVYEVIHCDENASDRLITFEQFKRALENIEFEQKMSIRFLHWFLLHFSNVNYVIYYNKTSWFTKFPRLF